MVAASPRPLVKNDIQVRGLTTPGRHACGAGLYLSVHAKKAGGVSKSWLVRFRVSDLAADGALITRPREAGLGSYPDVTLAEARRLAGDLRLRSKDGDPLKRRDDERRARILAERAAAEKAKRRVSFRDLAERYIASNSAGWKNDVHRRQWRSTLRTWAFPLIGDIVVDEIDRSAVLRVLQQPVHEPTGAITRPFWEARTETASRLRQRLETVLNYARALGLRDGDNPAAWQMLKFALPKRSAVKAVKHFAALSIDDLPGFMKDLRARPATSARALEFLILTAARTNEVLRAQWQEIDLARAVWNIPAERMKSKRGHRVALSLPAIRLLQGLQPGIGAALVFPNGKRPLSNMALLALVQGRMDKDVTVHGFRSVFRDYIGERTTFAPELAEAALAHLLGDKTNLAYQRGDLFERRREMMEAWAAFCSSAPASKAKRA